MEPLLPRGLTDTTAEQRGIHHPCSECTTGASSRSCPHCPETGAFLEQVCHASHAGILGGQLERLLLCLRAVSVCLPCREVSAPPCTAAEQAGPCCPRQPAPAPHLSSRTEAGPAHHSPEECSLQQYLKALCSALLPPILTPVSPKPHSSVPFHLSLVTV